MATRLRSSKPSHAVAPARAAAHRALLRLEQERAYLDRVVRRLEERLPALDRPLARRLAFGAAAYQETLDHLLQGLSRLPLARLDGAARTALRLGLYELLFLSGAPPWAVVNDQVELTFQRAEGPPAKRRAAAGYVNGVLRTALRRGSALQARLAGEGEESLILRVSHPRWLVRLWRTLLGTEEAVRLLAANNHAPRPALRLNRLVVGEGEVPPELLPLGCPDPLLPEAFLPAAAVDPGSLAAWQRGAVVAQSRGAILAGRLLDPRPGERLLDLCAGAGLKATHLAALIANRGEVVAVEPHPKRARLAAKLSARLGAKAVRVVVADGRAVGSLGTFDRVLVDAPCSGFGTLQRHPELKWRSGPRRVRELAALQAELLAAATELLRPGGVLLYVTCTISPTENEGNVAALLEAHADLSPLDLGALLPCASLSRLYAYRYRTPLLRRAASGSLLLLPSRHQSAGFFIAALRKGGERLLPFAPTLGGGVE